MVETLSQDRPTLSQLGYELLHIVYQRSDTTVYKGQRGEDIMAIKLQHQLDDFRYQKAFQECEAQLKFSDWEEIVPVVESFGYQKEGGTSWSFALITMWMESDLSNEIEYRKVKRNPWSQSELMDMANRLIGTFANLQRENVAHRDIKPQNIFLDSNSRLRVGDFGSSRQNFGPATLDLTVSGTPFYMSPEMKMMFLRSESSGHYNPYKSDVYSLGMVLLHCSMLNPPVKMLQLCDIAINTNVLLEQVQDTVLREVLRLMLQVNPAHRPDFLEVQGILSVKLQPLIPGGQKSLCDHSSSSYFELPCHGRICRVCAQATKLLANGEAQYVVMCRICRQQFHDLKKVKVTAEQSCSEDRIDTVSNSEEFSSTIKKFVDQNKPKHQKKSSWLTCFQPSKRSPKDKQKSEVINLE